MFVHYRGGTRLSRGQRDLLISPSNLHRLCWRVYDTSKDRGSSCGLFRKALKIARLQAKTRRV